MCPLHSHHRKFVHLRCRSMLLSIRHYLEICMTRAIMALRWHLKPGEASETVDHYQRAIGCIGTSARCQQRPRSVHVSRSGGNVEQSSLPEALIYQWVSHPICVCRQTSVTETGRARGAKQSAYLTYYIGIAQRCPYINESLGETVLSSLLPILAAPFARSR